MSKRVNEEKAEERERKKQLPFIDNCQESDDITHSAFLFVFVKLKFQFLLTRCRVEKCLGVSV
jgi:hypothetical protein